MGRFRVVDDDNDDDAVASPPGPPLWRVQNGHGDEFAGRELVTSPKHQEQMMYYYPPPGYESYHQPPRGFLSRHWHLVLSACVLLIAYGCHNYLPPAPPPTNTHHDDGTTIPSWSSYAQQHQEQLYQATKALFIDTPYHVGSWWMSIVWTEVRVYWGNEEQHRHRSSQCVWATPPPRTELRAQLQQSIQGQSEAIALLSDAIMAWDRTQPLVVLAVGFPSTGKRSLALALVRSLLVVEDGTDASSTCSSPSAAATVLHIQGWECTTQSEYYRLLLRIEHHRLQHTSGAMLMWTQVDHSDPSLVEQVLARVQSYSHLIVYLTTATGHGIQVLADALRSHTVPEQLDFHQPQPPQREPYERHVSLYLPFRPHTVESLTALLRAKPHVTFTDAAIQHILAPIAWIEWRNDAGIVVLTLAVDGAQALPWHQWKRLQRQHYGTSRRLLVHAPGETNHLEVVACSQEDTACVPVEWEDG